MGYRLLHLGHMGISDDGAGILRDGELGADTEVVVAVRDVGVVPPFREPLDEGGVLPPLLLLLSSDTFGDVRKINLNLLLILNNNSITYFWNQKCPIGADNNK